jgi:hypothetical protein
MAQPHFVGDSFQGAKGEIPSLAVSSDQSELAYSGDGLVVHLAQRNESNVTSHGWREVNDLLGLGRVEPTLEHRLCPLVG